jgi:hypothetical protein
MSVTNLFSDEILPLSIETFLEEYRIAKSMAVATTGKRLYQDGITNEEIKKKYYHFKFLVLGDNSGKTIYILSNDYKIDSIKADYGIEVEYRDRRLNLLKKTIEDSYYLGLIEKVVGVIRGNQVDFTIPLYILHSVQQPLMGLPLCCLFSLNTLSRALLGVRAVLGVHSALRAATGG